MTAFDITTLVLSEGMHVSPAQGACFLEVVSLLAGDAFTDHPPCVCPVIAEFGRVLNDNMPDDATRTRLLLPYAEKLLGTIASEEVRQKRAFLLADWTVRVIAPKALEKAGLRKHAIKLRNLAPVVDKNTAANARKAANAAYVAARPTDADAACTTYAAANAAHAANAACVNVASAADAAAAAADEDVWTQAAAMIGTLCEVT